MKRYRIANVNAAAASRKPGYLEAVMQMAVLDGEWLELTDEQVASLAVYRLEEPVHYESSKPYIPQPGDALASVIRSIGYAKTAGCGCAVMQIKMNEWGWMGCLARTEEICTFLQAQAAKNGVTVENATVLSLLKASLNELFTKTK